MSWPPGLSILFGHPGRRRSAAFDAGAVASVAQRLAVLLEAGVPGGSAWSYLGEVGPATAIAGRVASGESIGQAISTELATLPPADRTAWRMLAAAWTVAAQAGASLAPTLENIASLLRDFAASRRDIAVALASPIATARLVTALPLVGILFGYVLGIDTLSTLFGSPLGWCCLGLGGTLLGGAVVWNRRLIRVARPRDLVPGFLLDLTAIALAGGAAPGPAVASVAQVLARFDLPGGEASRVAGVIDLSQRAGVPAGALLRSEAEQLRRDARTSAQIAAQRLSVRLMLPLGVCVLPAFMVLGVAPVLLAIVGQTSFG